MPASITLVGRLFHKPETKQAGSSTITKAKVPCDVGFGDKKTTTWWTIEVWGVSGQRLAQYTDKGDVVMFSGEPSVREYTKQDGTKGFSAEIKNASWGFTPKPAQVETNVAPDSKPIDFDREDLPF